MKIKFWILIFIIFSIFNVFCEEQLLSAKDFLTSLSDKFRENVEDMVADIAILTGDEVQSGTIKFKNPQKLYITLTEPQKQEICTDGYDLWVYIQNLNLLLQQRVQDKKKEKNENEETILVETPIMINPVGYERFIRDYSIQYLESRSKVKDEDGEYVYKLKLIRWQTSKNGFNVVYLTIKEDGIIKKVEGINAAYRKFTIQLDNIKTNVGLDNSEFNYEKPAHVNTIDNFIKQGD